MGRMFGTHLLRALWRGDVPPAKAGIEGRGLERVVGRIEEHVGDSLRLAVLGRVAGMSPSHFGRLFKVSTGRAPHAYVLQRRVAKAQHLLRCRIQIVVD